MFAHYAIYEREFRAFKCDFNVTFGRAQPRNRSACQRRCWAIKLEMK